ncbi:MAG: pyridoxamine 5'-phosphate oxidase family protein [Planctomycetes bacterium]|nr:pyridoxamine 5'-phosphate oxidase family protein [Planctomycetota bacterium]MCB9886683.1 pyridoxamine 5'-phosphate oxidase family protein [Planctomycetota bacterium]
MAREFLRTMLTPSVRAAQARYYDKQYPNLGAESDPDALGPEEIAFLRERDSFYMATVTENGWPYVQHRGGSTGFLVAISARELLFADYGGNRQLISVGNLQHRARVCLFVIDYPGRTRLKIIGEAQVLDAQAHPELAAAAAPPGGHAAAVERIVRITVRGFDWNCPKFITPRWSRAEVEAATRPLHDRIAALEAELHARAAGS